MTEIKRETKTEMTERETRERDRERKPGQNRMDSDDWQSDTVS